MSPSTPQSSQIVNHRPWVTVILAMGIDGKISDSHRTAARFPSVADKQHLEHQVAAADATLFGAGTLRAYGTTALVKTPALLAQRRQQKQGSQPIHIVCSRSGRLATDSRFFQQPVPRWLLTTPAGAKNWDGTSRFERIWIAPEGESPQHFDWPQILGELKALTVDRLLVMGGGQLVSALMHWELVDELWITVCPLVIGGAQAPTPCDGPGFSIANAPRFTLISHRIVGDEVFLHYRRRP